MPAWEKIAFVCGLVVLLAVLVLAALLVWTSITIGPVD
jgi:hypothetical protein